jgi:nitrous oxide reductase accessory protein NosL
MKRVWIIIGILLSLTTACLAANRIEEPASCLHCGMDRTMFAHSRMIITYTDGSSVGTCSLYCIATDLQQAQGKKVKSVQVADYGTKKLIDARKATWVVGGSKQGVMTAVAKWAFAKKSDADAFIKENGGRLAKFDAVLGAAVKEQPAVDGGQRH